MIRNLLQRAAWRLEKVLDPDRPLHMGGEDLPKLAPEQLEEVRRHFARPKFFITGYSRSGKTLLARLIRLHPEVHCNWHSYFFSQDWNLVGLLSTSGLESNLERQANRWTKGKKMLTPIIRVACDFIMERQAEEEGKRIVGDETPNPNNEIAIHRMNAIYPDANVLIVVRDGREVILWRRILYFIDLPHTLGREDLTIMNSLRKNSSPYLSGERSIFTSSWLERFAAEWAANVRNSVALARELYGDQCEVIRYEDLVADPAGHMIRAWEFLGVQSLENPPSQAISDEMQRDPETEWHMSQLPELVTHLKPGTHENWKQVFTDEDRLLFERIAGHELEAFGYELSSHGL